MIAKYDPLFDLKVTAAAARLTRDFGMTTDCAEIARLVLLTAMEVEANEKNKGNL